MHLYMCAKCTYLFIGLKLSLPIQREIDSNYILHAFLKLYTILYNILMFAVERVHAVDAGLVHTILN